MAGNRSGGLRSILVAALLLAAPSAIGQWSALERHSVDTWVWGLPW
jgi:hypothetical protein